MGDEDGGKSSEFGFVLCGEFRLVESADTLDDGRKVGDGKGRGDSKELSVGLGAGEGERQVG